MDKDKCIELIKLYEGQRHLWDPTSPHHYNKAFKEDSWKIISEQMRLSVAEVKKKMTELCGSFRREKSRYKQSLITESGRNDVYVSKWFAYEHFHFLADKFTPRQTQDSMTIDTSSSKETDTMSTSTEPSTARSDTISIEESAEANASLCETSSNNSTFPHRDQQQSQPLISKSNKRKATDTFEENIDLNKAVEVLNYKDDSYNMFGKHIAAELRKYDPATLVHVKKRIIDIIFQADTDMLRTSVSAENSINNNYSDINLTL